ncbi:hypothetical protein WS0672 [Wolinella succinogenes]|uniref:Uncharacterized protein n=1 Tax=Wolinella succinogenes (strain ATCC 29543 / DSM 1740 / CCUG 13145 / JCM 31913 / LMG 7466 / NCTC 11488 / FDC 602W) TaxID=273121 RepID=Q7MS85_WOLSU|nr:hypothetical protein WS0672 [Wolinella succinogenes]
MSTPTASSSPPLPLLFDHLLSDEVSYKLRARRVPLAHDFVIKLGEKVFRERDGESNDIVHGWYPLWRNLGFCSRVILSKRGGEVSRGGVKVNHLLRKARVESKPLSKKESNGRRVGGGVDSGASIWLFFKCGDCPHPRG